MPQKLTIFGNIKITHHDIKPKIFGTSMNDIKGLWVGTLIHKKALDFDLLTRLAIAIASAAAVASSSRLALPNPCQLGQYKLVGN